MEIRAGGVHTGFVEELLKDQKSRSGMKRRPGRPLLPERWSSITMISTTCDYLNFEEADQPDRTPPELCGTLDRI